MTPPDTTSERPVRVGMHALIDPYGAGGSESSVMSIIDNLSSRDLGIELRVLVLPSFAAKMAERTGNRSIVVPVPFREIGPVQISAGGRVGRTLAWTGGLRPLLEPLALWYVAWRMRPRMSAEEIDQFLQQQGVDVLHFGYSYNFPTRFPFIYEPHDIQHKTYPEFFTPQELSWRDEVYTRGITSAAFVVCGTRWTKGNIVEKFGVRPEKVAVIPRYSVNARVPVAARRQQEIAVRLRLPERYAYYPAMTFPHKNHLRLLEALALLRDRHGMKLHLVCTGRLFQRHQGELMQAVRRLGLEDQVKFLGPLPEDELVTVFERASLVVFPSLFEGLSQALLEALAFGKPIVAARQSSIPETVGDAAILFDGCDIEAIVDALHRAISRPDVLREAAARTKAQLARYDWDRAAVALAACYKKAAGRRLSVEESAALAQATG